MTIKIGKYRITINVTSEDYPRRRTGDIIIDTAKRDQMINDMEKSGINFADIREKARVARLSRQTAGI